MQLLSFSVLTLKLSKNPENLNRFKSYARLVPRPRTTKL